MKYKLNPTGYVQPSVQRIYARPSCKLAKAFEKWDRSLEGLSPHDSYEKAVKDRIKADSVDEIHALLIRYKDHSRIRFSGFFVSAVYKNMEAKEVVYDLDIGEIDNIGYMFPGRIINKGRVGDCFGQEANEAWNFGICESFFGWGAKNAWNFGICGHHKGYDNGLMIDTDRDLRIFFCDKSMEESEINSPVQFMKELQANAAFYEIKAFVDDVRKKSERGESLEGASEAVRQIMRMHGHDI